MRTLRRRARMHKHTTGSPLAELDSGDSHTPQWVLDSSAPRRRWIALEAFASDVLRARSGLAAIGTSRLDAQAQGTRAGGRQPLFSFPTGRALPGGRVP
jgi:hypothetical protein